jgi:hypothetical protein
MSFPRRTRQFTLVEMSRWKYLGAVGFIGAALAGACGTEEPEQPKPSPCAQADVDQCRVNQQACEVDGGKASCIACGDGQMASTDGACVPIPGTATAHDFAMFTTDPGQEVLGLCQSWTLDNAEDIWVNAVELSQDELSHHSNWTFVPDTKFAGDDGVWNCKDRNYDELSAAVAGGVLYAQSTQATHEVQRFPDGAAVRIPPHSRIIGDVHLLNVSGEARTGHAKLTIYSIAPNEVTHKLTPFHMTYTGLDIPPHSSSRFTGDCDLATQYETSTGKPFALKLYYSLPHTHALGTRFFLKARGGPVDGESLIDVAGFNGEARGKAYDPPIDLGGASGLEFGCEFQNPRDDEVQWGFGDQEMCEMLGFVEADAAFQSEVSTAVSAGADGDVQLFTGPCETIVIPWDQKQQ